MAEVVSFQSLDIDRLREILKRVEAETIQHDDEDFQSNPLKNAAAKLYGRLKVAAERISLEGMAAFEAARNSVVVEWELLKEALGAQASELLALFQQQIHRLIDETMQAIAKAVPAALNRPDQILNLDSIAFKLALGLSPSVSAGATEWLKLAANAGAEVTLSYKAPAAS